MRGREAGFWELPLSFELDDWVHFQFNFDPYRKGGAPPRHVREIWEAEFDWMHANVDDGVLVVTMHPQVIGRGSRIAMLDEFIRHCGERGRGVQEHGGRGEVTGPGYLSRSRAPHARRIGTHSTHTRAPRNARFQAGMRVAPKQGPQPLPRVGVRSLGGLGTRREGGWLQSGHAAR